MRLSFGLIWKIVSIHAPWEGCDICIRQILLNLGGFNSRTLGRVRQIVATPSLVISPFQFTHPGKGATTSSYYRYAPLGCFNSRTLGRVRLVFNNAKVFLGVFQFTHPGKGATKMTLKNFLHPNVSIHAPWEGCDPTTPSLLTR